MKLIKCVALMVAVCLVLSACSSFSLPTKEEPKETKKTSEDKGSNKPNKTQEASTDAVKESSKPTEPVVVVTLPPETDPYVGGQDSFQNLRIGEVGKRGNAYIGLQYVKVMPYLPTALGKEDVDEDHEVILGFFEFLNGDNKTIQCYPDDITCYVDGIQATNVKTYIKVLVDGVWDHHWEDIDSGYTMLTVQHFEVKKGWKVINFFYGSECSWALENIEVSENPYERTSLFNIAQSAEPTALDSIIYTGDYDIQYKGSCFYHTDGVVRDYDYLIFKFHITNNMSTELDMSFMGYEMRAYQDMTFLGDAEYTLKDKIDEFVNIYDIKSLAPGMSANIYVAFERLDESPDVTLFYDDGYIKSHYCGTVYDTVR